MTPSPDIAAYCLGELDPAARLEVETLAAASPAVRRRIDDYSRALAELRGWPAALEPFTVSAAARARLTSIPETLRAADPLARTQGAIRRLVARLVHDTDQGALVPGFRGQASTRHLRFESDAGSVFVKVEPLPRAGTLLVGRYEGDRAPTEVVARSEDRQRSAPLDVMGFFELPVDAGRWELTIHLSDGELVLPAVDVGA